MNELSFKYLPYFLKKGFIALKKVFFCVIVEILNLWQGEKVKYPLTYEEPFSLTLKFTFNRYFPTILSSIVHATY